MSLCETAVTILGGRDVLGFVHFVVLRIVRRGYEKADGSTAARGALGVHCAAVSLHQVLDDGEAEPRPSLLADPGRGADR